MTEYLLQTSQTSTDLDYGTLAFYYRIYDYFFLAGLVILVYDHLLTLETEIKYIWLPKLRPSTCWFLTVRYLALASNIMMSVYNFGDLNHEVCPNCLKMQWAWMFLIVSQETIIEATLCIRVFAMYGLNKLVLTCLMGVTCVVAGLGLWAIVGYGKHSELLVVSGLSGCHATYRTLTAVRPAGVWEATLVCDILVFALTIRRAYIQSRTSVLYAGSLLQRMFTDGSMYFGIIVLATLANVLTFYVDDAIVSGFLSWFTTNLSVTMLCRLMLNLHQAGGLGMDTAEPNTIDLESIQFVVPTTAMTDYEDERL
ncbi:hypothetical protein DFH08DRAFT_833891 [Mycena albidolilacea]|uniref:DUF6533 domain-containing protein n=1 Tax=Mycena albidolilacea TaxID=1033008 RepID=A0AAD7AQV9_9AGAR|nr:hypothetical protein DFH08DRAFT_833891 [Mycena albidolilacea]